MTRDEIQAELLALWHAGDTEALTTFLTDQEMMDAKGITSTGSAFLAWMQDRVVSEDIYRFIQETTDTVPVTDAVAVADTRYGDTTTTQHDGGLNDLPA
jgi:hypothetical protein